MATATLPESATARIFDVPEWDGYGMGPGPYRFAAVIDATYPPDRDGKPDAQSGERAEALGVVLGECALCEQPIERHLIFESSDGSRRCVCPQCLVEAGTAEFARELQTLDRLSPPAEFAPAEPEPEPVEPTEPAPVETLKLEPEAKPKRKASGKAKPAQPDTCRLSLQIRDTAYSVRPAHNEAHRAGRAWRLSKPDGGHYHVAETDHGPACDCADWTFRREHLDPAGCKHIRALTALGMIDRS